MLAAVLLAALAPAEPSALELAVERANAAYRALPRLRGKWVTYAGEKVAGSFAVWRQGEWERSELTLKGSLYFRNVSGPKGFVGYCPSEGAYWEEPRGEKSSPPSASSPSDPSVIKVTSDGVVFPSDPPFQVTSDEKERTRDGWIRKIGFRARQGKEFRIRGEARFDTSTGLFREARLRIWGEQPGSLRIVREVLDTRPIPETVFSLPAAEYAGYEKVSPKDLFGGR